MPTVLWDGISFPIWPNAATRSLQPQEWRPGLRIRISSASSFRICPNPLTGNHCSDNATSWSISPEFAHKFAVEDLYDRVNHQATASLARAAFRCGTKHLVLISSISAQSGTFSDHELTEMDPPKPNNDYGRSKLAAEKAVRAAGVPFTILRPVVIYGQGEKGNFATLHKISRFPIPLPFGRLRAKRSVLSIENFMSAVETTLTNPRARGETLHRIRSNASHSRRAYRALPRQPKQTILAAARARTMA